MMYIYSENVYLFLQITIKYYEDFTNVIITSEYTF